MDVVRPVEGGPPWRYDGDVATESQRFRASVVVAADGTVSVDLPDDAPDGLADKVRLFARTAWKHASEDALPPPRRISRWRPDG